MIELPEDSKDGCQYGADQLLSDFDKQVEQLKNTDVENFRRKIEEAPTIGTISTHIRHLMEMNIPASLGLLESLLEKHRNDKLLYLELMSHRHNLAMRMESFTRARAIAEEARHMAKELCESSENGSMDPELFRELTYKAYIQSCINLIVACTQQEKIADAEVYLEEANRVANDEDAHLLRIYSGYLLLARRKPNDAIDRIFIPLLCKTDISRRNKAILLQMLGIAYRCTARWGLAKQYFRQAIEIAHDLEDRISEFDRARDLGSVYQLEGSISNSIEQMIPQMEFAFKRGDSLGLSMACYSLSEAYCALKRKPDMERAHALACLHARLFYRLAHDVNAHPTLACKVSQILILFTKHERTGSAGQTLRTLNCRHVDGNESSGSLECERFLFGMIRNKIRIVCTESAEQTPRMPEFKHFFLGKQTCCDRSTGKYDEVIEEHNKHLLNATRREDYFCVAQIQTELAIDYVCKGDFDNAEKRARDAILTLESIRSKLGGEDASKIANFDKNQSEAYNLLQIILCRQGKHSEALALSELARSRALTDLIRDKLMKTSGAQTESWIYSSDCVSRWQELERDILSDFIKSADQLNTNFLVYSVVKELGINGSAQPWLYIWLVLNENSANGGNKIRFERQILNEDVLGELEDNIFFSSLTRSFRILAERENTSAKKNEIDIEPQREEETIRVKIADSQVVMEFIQVMQSLTLTKMDPTMSTTKEADGEQVLPKDTVQQSENLEAAAKEGELGDSTADIVLERMMECGSWDKEGINRLLQLYKVCIAPINDYLPETKDGIVPSITIIPHEFLFSVPFCCLHNGNSEYFVERFVLSYAPSLQALLLLNQRLKHLKCEQGKRNLKLLAMGNPTMVLPGIKELPCSGDEAKQVQAVFDPELSQLATRSDATKSLLLRELKNIDILHVATHASSQDIEVNDEKSQGDYSMRGCLLLASSDEETCEGVVYASEIAAVDSTCQLITLSCCETGLGKVTGDGVLGLYRAFLAAGTASLLVTLWKISDNITPIFMEHFYNEFKATGNVSGSLRSAMLYCIREKKLPPQHWAAFSLIGAISS